LQEIVTRGTHEEKLNIVEIAYANGHELNFAKHIALVCARLMDGGETECLNCQKIQNCFYENELSVSV
jgi:hypothetical protein